MKPLPPVVITLEDWEAWHWSQPDWNDMARLKLMDAYEASDRRDAELMLGLTGTAPGSDGICVAYLWLIG